MTKSDSLLLVARHGPGARRGSPARRRVAANVSCRVGSRMTPTAGRAIDDEPDRDAEHGDAVGVVDRAVERVDDPDPATPRGGRLARHRRDARRSPRPGSRRPGSAPGSRRGSAPRTGGPPRSRRPGRSCSRSARAARSGPSARSPARSASSSREAPASVRGRAPRPGSPRHGRTEHVDLERPDRRSELGHVLRERHGLPPSIFGLRMNAARVAGPVGRVGRPGRSSGPALVPLLVTVRVTASPAAVGDGGRRPSPRTARRPASASLAATARMTTNRTTPPIAMPWTCELDDVAQAERVAALAQPDVERRPGRRTGRTRGSARACGGVGRGAAVRGVVTWLMVPRTAAASTAYQRPVASTSASTSAVVRASTIAPSAPAACQRAQVSRGALDPRRVRRSARRSASRPGTRRARAGPRAAGRLAASDSR